MAGEVYNIASSGLQLAQRGLNTSSNNISKANVDGYSRQRLDTSGIADLDGIGVAANASRINGYVQRFNDTFIHSQITTEQSSLQSADTYHRLAT
ncbi:MAG: flagellar basal body protein, partial [Methylococcaceae bacterium]